MGMLQAAVAFLAWVVEGWALLGLGVRSFCGGRHCVVRTTPLTITRPSAACARALPSRTGEVCHTPANMTKRRASAAAETGGQHKQSGVHWTAQRGGESRHLFSGPVFLPPSPNLPVSTALRRSARGVATFILHRISRQGFEKREMMIYSLRLRLPHLIACAGPAAYEPRSNRQSAFTMRCAAVHSSTVALVLVDHDHALVLASVFSSTFSRTHDRGVVRAGRI